MPGISRFTPVGIAVVVALVLMSLVSLAVIVDRWRAFRRARRLSLATAESLGRLLRDGRARDAASAARSQSDPQAHLARVLATGLQEWELVRPLEPDPEAAAFAVREAVRQAASLSIEEMRRGLTALATIGSTAPFVGLFGTTFGILTAFSD